MSAYEELMAQRGDGAEPDTPSGSAAEPASASMARLLELAAHNADELLEEARAEAAQVTSTARVEAERLLSEARAEAERIRAESEKSRNHANQEIAGLRQTEQEHRERMQSHLQEMLAKVEANSIG
jgi:cell division septum initiation protein DivIVA